ncbi:MAG TPA: extracellular solute-binding protein, partial [Phototrophicaceae bacterium]|nr:extracellular solute-binding protein [Phototrophicaceae bacterium]
IPFVAKPKVMGINVDLFKAAGIPIPSLTDRMTTQEFQDLATKLSSGDGDQRVFGSAPLWFGGWLFIFGNTFYNADGTQVTVGDQSAIDAANFVIDSANKYHYAPTAAESTGQDMFNWFLSGKVAMFPDFGPWDLPLIKPVTDMNWELVPDPGKGEPLEIDGFGISAQSQNPDAAKTIATCLSQNKDAQEILGSSAAAVGVPVVQPAADDFAKSIPNHNINAFVLAAADSPIQYGNKIDGQIQDTFNHEINSRTALGTGTEDPATVFPEVAKELNALFNQ